MPQVFDDMGYLRTAGWRGQGVCMGRKEGMKGRLATSQNLGVALPGEGHPAWDEPLLLKYEVAISDAFVF